ncbi:hypothetical protein BB560_000381 [Smittium megazygosporum]|uniref:Phosphatidylethanolamine-binding protein n=1 Tax=Smittium megazygosporum TaxID=133381 RepID=A0A2T9ZKG5_9FUNG|nr:hypothetical protein BB560_000381 [Smittium megazygosporum]
MKFYIALGLLSVLARANGQAFTESDDANDIIEELREEGFIPSVIPANFVPTTNLEVEYAGRRMDFGTEYYPNRNEVNEIPRIRYVAEPNTYYTIALVDPDAPSRANPYRAQVRHWLNVNIPMNDISAGNSTGTPYLPPIPFAGCGEKRFVYILAKQQSELPNLTVTQNRANFDFAKFAADNSMTIIGANYFEVESEPGPSCSVPSGSSTGSSTTSSTASTTGSSTTSSTASTTGSSATSSTSSTTDSSTTSRSTSSSSSSNSSSSSAASIVGSSSLYILSSIALLSATFF